MKKLKAIVTINLGLYMDIRPEIEIEVPDNLKGQELVKWLHTKYHGLLTPNGGVCQVCGGKSVYGGEALVDGVHPKCRVNEGYKLKNL